MQAFVFAFEVEVEVEVVFAFEVEFVFVFVCVRVRGGEGAWLTLRMWEGEGVDGGLTRKVRSTRERQVEGKKEELSVEYD